MNLTQIGIFKLDQDSVLYTFLVETKCIENVENVVKNTLKLYDSGYCCVAQNFKFLNQDGSFNYAEDMFLLEFDDLTTPA